MKDYSTSIAERNKIILGLLDKNLSTKNVTKKELLKSLVIIKGLVADKKKKITPDESKPAKELQPYINLRTAAQLEIAKKHFSKLLESGVLNEEEYNLFMNCYFGLTDKKPKSLQRRLSPVCKKADLRYLFFQYYREVWEYHDPSINLRKRLCLILIDAFDIFENTKAQCDNLYSNFTKEIPLPSLIKY